MDLSEKYYDPKQPGSFQGADKLYRHIEGLSKKEAQDWLSSQESYTSTRSFRTPKKRRLRVPLVAPNYQWDADCAFLPGFEENGYRGFLLCIDIFSRQIHARAIKTASSQQVVDSLKEIFRTSKPKVMRTDAGVEFRAKSTKRFLQSQNVTHYVTHNPTQANFAERAIKSIKTRLLKYMVYKNEKKWVGVLADMVYSYNDTFHSSLGRSPNSAMEGDPDLVLLQQYVINPPKQHQKRPFRFDVGDAVKIPHTRQKFDRGYDVKWGGEIMTVVKRYRNQNINLYKLTGYDEDPIAGSFQEWELQKVSRDADAIYKIDRVIRTKGRGKKKMAFVSWLNWSSRFNSWIPYGEIEVYKNV